MAVDRRTADQVYADRQRELRLIEKLVAMFIIAMGKAIGEGFTYFPKLPSCFTQHIMFPNRFYADFLCLRVSSSLEVEVWFVTTEKETICISFGEIERSQPHLFASLITHVFDMIENRFRL